MFAMGGDGNRKGMTLIIYRKRQTNVFSYRMTLHGVLLKSDIVRLSALAGGDKPRPYAPASLGDEGIGPINIAVS